MRIKCHRHIEGTIKTCTIRPKNNISEAVIDRLVTKGVVKPSISDTVNPEPMNYEANRIDFDGSPKPVQNQYKTILKHFKGIRTGQRKMVEFLVEREPASYTIRQLKKWLGYNSSKELEKHPATQYITLGLIFGTKTSQYKADTKSFVENQFEVFRPEIGDEEMKILVKKFRSDVSLF